MAIWGAPLDIEDHAQQAVDTARAMEPALAKLNKELREQGLIELNIVSVLTLAMLLLVTWEVTRDSTIPCSEIVLTSPQD